MDLLALMQSDEGSDEGSDELLIRCYVSWQITNSGRTKGRRRC